MIVVDRIEGDRAVLEIDGEIVDIPASALPSGVVEGAVLALLVQNSADISQQAQARLERLKARDTSPNDIEL